MLTRDRREYHKKYLAIPAVKARRKQYGKDYWDKLRSTILDHYGWKCNCCGETMPKFLTIDHVNNDGYKDRSKSGNKLTGSKMILKIINEGFSDKYQILCFNCNCGKARNNGICPHKDI